MIRLNVRRLVRDLGRCFDRYEKELEASAKLRVDFAKHGPRGRALHLPRGETEVWRRYLNG